MELKVSQVKDMTDRERTRFFCACEILIETSALLWPGGQGEPESLKALRTLSNETKTFGPGVSADDMRQAVNRFYQDVETRLAKANQTTHDLFRKYPGISAPAAV